MNDAHVCLCAPHAITHLYSLVPIVGSETLKKQFFFQNVIFHLLTHEHCTSDVKQKDTQNKIANIKHGRTPPI